MWCYSAHNGSETYNLASLLGQAWLGALPSQVFCWVLGIPTCYSLLTVSLGQGKRLSFLILRACSVQFQVRTEHQGFIDEWMQMVIDLASCGAGSVPCLHHRMTSEHMVTDLWPDSGPGLDEPAH